MLDKILYIIRGVSGSGKTTFASTLGCEVASADDFFMVDGEYRFDPKKLPKAHEYCRVLVCGWMVDGESVIAVANTFTQDWEMEPYYIMAKDFGYTVFSIIVENRHGGKNEHGVPEQAVQGMRDRFSIKL